MYTNIFFWIVFILNTAGLGYQGYRIVAKNYTLLYLLHIAYPTLRQKFTIICKTLLSKYIDSNSKTSLYTPIFETKSTCVVTKTGTNTFEAAFMIGNSAIKVMLEQVVPEIIDAIEVKNSDSKYALINSVISEAKPFVAYKPLQWKNDSNIKYYFRDGTSSNIY